MTGDRISALLVEDNPADARLLREMLLEAGGGAISLDWVDTMAAGLERLEVAHPDVVLLDLTLPESQGLDTFDTVNRHAPRVPIIALTGLDDEALAGQAVRRGAQDYLVKGQVDGELLVRAVRYAIERKQAQAALRHYAEEQSALYAITSAVATSLEADALLDTMLEVVATVLDATAAWVILPDTEGNLYVAAARGIPPAAVADMSPFRAQNCAPFRGEGLGGSAVHEAGTYSLCPFLPEPARAALALTGHACIPLSVGGQQLGVLTVGWQVPHLTLGSDEALLMTIGRQLGLALHNAQLYQQARQVDRLRVLNELDGALAATLDPARVAEATLSRIAAALDAPRALYVPHAPAGGAQRLVLTLTDGWIEQEEAAHDTLWAPFLASSPAHLARDGDGSGGGVLALGIQGDGKHVADLVLAGRPADRPFNTEDVALARAAASRAGQAVRNAQLYAEVTTLLREREETQARLIHSEKMAALGRLTASIAHEINNPIQSVLSCLNLVQEEIEEPPGFQDPDTTLNYLNIAEGEIQRIADIVRRMHDFYRPTGNAHKKTDVHQVLEAVLSLTHKQLQHAEVFVVREWTSDVPALFANADQLKQVFLNLVLNAADAMPRGGTLLVRTAADVLPQRDEGPARCAVRIEFCDTGQGMTPDVRARLFEPFFTTKESGSGLGLYISYGIVEAHGGQIVVDSQPGVGTTLAVLLPAMGCPSRVKDKTESGSQTA